MSKIIFMYGVMDAAKSAELLMTAYKYQQLGFNTVLIKPSQDTRSGDNIIASRMGLSAVADIVISPETNKEDLDNILTLLLGKDPHKSIILVDEAQFIDPKNVHYIASKARKLGSSMFAYGLLKTFKNTLFSGSSAWIVESDTIREIKTTCSIEGCGKKATHNVRTVDGLPVYEGRDIEVGDAAYFSVCANHYYNFPKIIDN